MARFSILVDVTKCSGCYNCFLACRDEYYNNDYPPYSAAQPLNGQLWMQIKEIERGAYPKPKLSYIPIPCMHCQSAPCMEAAQDGAIYRRPDGIVVIDPVKAMGQRQVVNACPYRVIFWNEEKQIPQKCTMCAHRLDAGEKQPRCVESCPTGALVFGDLDDPQSEISRLAAERGTENFHPEYKTAPSVQYVGIPKRFIAGEVVLQDKTEECAQGVSIILEGGGIRREVQSDVFGDFEFEGLPQNADFTVTVEQKGYTTRTLQAKTHKDVNLGEIVLQPSK